MGNPAQRYYQTAYTATICEKRVSLRHDPTKQEKKKTKKVLMFENIWIVSQLNAFIYSFMSKILL